jgi:hypothetical protein
MGNGANEQTVACAPGHSSASTEDRHGKVKGDDLHGR